MRRRRSKIIQSTEQRLADESIRLRSEASALPPGIAREKLMRMARQCETASHMSAWLASPGLRSPK